MKTKQSPGRELEDEFSYSSLEEATVRLDNLNKIKNPTQEVLDEIAAIEELLLESKDKDFRLTKSNMGFAQGLKRVIFLAVVWVIIIILASVLMVFVA